MAKTKTIGLIGGMSWESSAEYYRIINERITHSLGKAHSAKIIMFSIDFFELLQLSKQNRWDEAATMMLDAAKKLETCGADFLAICANTMHKASYEVERNINIPLIHIVDKTAEKIIAAGIKKVGLLGTKITMEETFYRHRLKEKYNVDTIIPNEADRDVIQGVIFEELCMSVVKNTSREKFKTIIQSLSKQEAEAVILGCTELTLLIKQTDSNIPFFDTTKIHAEAIADYATT